MTRRNRRRKKGSSFRPFAEFTNDELMELDEAADDVISLCAEVRDRHGLDLTIAQGEILMGTIERLRGQKTA